jgi:sn-glycerol 3-phosphate transport system ATP-binding protein
MATVEFRNVEKNYAGTKAIHGVDIQVGDGEFVVIVGPSGCGKSTLLRMVAGLEEISGGQILIDHAVVNDREPAERDIAMVFQNYALYPHKNVFDNMAYGLRIRGMPAAEIRQRVDAAAAILELGALLERKPGQLSGGQRQRVAMGRAIVREPKVFLFDEPLSNLDAKLRVQMRLEIKQLHGRLGTTSLYVTHDQVEAMTLAQRMIVMNRGVAEQIGTPKEVYETPATTFVAGFIGSPPMNILEGLLADDGAAFALADTAQYRLPANAGGARLAPGRNYLLGVRPEHLAPAASGVPFQVTLVEALGAEYLVHGVCPGRNGDQQLVVRTSSDGMAAGQRMHLNADAHRLHWFDALTQRRVATDGTARVAAA